MKPIVQLTNISKTFIDGSEKLLALQDITLHVVEGEFLTLVGPSGSGKSTLLRIMSGLEPSFEGQRTLAPGVSGQNMSFVFQQFALLPWLTVSQNIAFALISKQMSVHEKKQRVSRELQRFGLEKFATSRPRELSGGMRQRVGIARALAANPKIIFMDEPFSELDSFTAEELRAQLLSIWHEQHPTIVMVTHIIPDAIELSSRIAVITPRPGRIEKIITDTLPYPRARRSKEFFAYEDEIYKRIKP